MWAVNLYILNDLRQGFVKIKHGFTKPGHAFGTGLNLRTIRVQG